MAKNLTFIELLFALFEEIVSHYKSLFTELDYFILEFTIPIRRVMLITIKIIFTVWHFRSLSRFSGTSFYEIIIVCSFTLSSFFLIFSYFLRVSIRNLYYLMIHGHFIVVVVVVAHAAWLLIFMKDHIILPFLSLILIWLLIVMIIIGKYIILVMNSSILMWSNSRNRFLLSQGKPMT